jgi:hypothetical protein
MLTEFGNQADGAPEVAAVCDLADAAQQSWIYWGGMDQVPGAQLKRDLVRTYAQAVAGRPLSMTFNRYDGNAIRLRRRGYSLIYVLFCSILYYFVIFLLFLFFIIIFIILPLLLFFFFRN